MSRLDTPPTEAIVRDPVWDGRGRLVALQVGCAVLGRDGGSGLNDREEVLRPEIAEVAIGDAVREALIGWEIAAVGPVRVTVVICDRTRPLDYTQTLEPLLSALVSADAAITILVALGLHRPMNEPECEELRGLSTRFGARLCQHHPTSVALVCRAGTDLWRPRFHREHILAADHLITVGVVEPHQYAGFSGGIKGISVGCADRETIARLHGLALLRDPLVQVGRIEANPFQAALWDIAAGLPPTLGLFVVPAGNGRVFGAVFGEVRAAFERSVAIARSHHFRSYPAQVDWLVARVPQSKALTFYQASRAATYIAMVEAPVVRRGGWILVEAACPEGIGLGAGERACEEAMRRGVDVLLAELDGRRPCENVRGGEQRAYVLARSLERCQIGLIGPPITALSSMGIPSFPSLESARRALGLDGTSLVVEDVFRSVPFWSPP
jgi:lactate racemase